MDKNKRNNIQDILDIVDSGKKYKFNLEKDIEFYEDVSSLILEARLQAGLTQKELAKRMKTKQSSISRIESAKSLPSLSFLLDIAHALNTYLIAPKFGFMDDHTTLTMDVVSSANSHVQDLFANEVRKNKNSETKSYHHKIIK